MRDAILSIPSQLTEGIRLGTAATITRPYRRVVCFGMGGSSIAGEMYSMLADNVVVHWDYGLPSGIGAQDLAVCTSWSGDTEEVISSYEAARAAGMDTLVITSGGRLAALAGQNGTPLIKLPSDPIPPRTATGYMTGALVSALGKSAELPRELDAAALEPAGEELAAAVSGRMLALYAAHPWRKLTGFWKMAYSETVKRQVMANWMPSGAHTEIVGWEGPYRDTVAPLFLRDTADEDPRHTVALDALLAILEKYGYTCLTVRLSGTSVLEKALNGYILGLWTAYHAARELGVDPQVTELLDEYKKLKSQKA